MYESDKDKFSKTSRHLSIYGAPKAIRFVSKQLDVSQTKNTQKHTKLLQKNTHISADSYRTDLLKLETSNI